MPEVVYSFVKNGNYSGTLQMQRQLLKDYEDDITKYAEGLDKTKVKNVYSHISVFLAKDNKKYQITKVARGARSREYIGTVDWLSDAGIVNVCYCRSKATMKRIISGYISGTQACSLHRLTMRHRMISGQTGISGHTRARFTRISSVICL